MVEYGKKSDDCSAEILRSDSKGAKVRKSCRAREMLKDAPILAIGGVDTAEYGPSKVWGFLIGGRGVIMRILADCG